MTLSRKDIEKQLEIEHAILAELDSGRYSERNDSLLNSHQPTPGAAWVHESLPGREFFPVFPFWDKTVRLRIGALQLILERMPPDNARRTGRRTVDLSTT